jgi:hypothetical protein
MARSGAANLLAWQKRAGVLAALTANENEKAVARAKSLIQMAVDELGGNEAALTAKQAHVLESQKLALTVLCLAQAHFDRKGLLIRRARPDPLLSVVVSFANTVRLNLESLGLSDVSDPTRAANDELAEIAAQIRGDRHAQDS